MALNGVRTERSQKPPSTHMGSLINCSYTFIGGLATFAQTHRRRWTLSDVDPPYFTKEKLRGLGLTKARYTERQPLKRVLVLSRSGVSSR